MSKKNLKLFFLFFKKFCFRNKRIFKMSSSASGAKKSKEKEQQEIINNFQKLREEQKMIASKSAELQIEQKSHE